MNLKTIFLLFLLCIPFCAPAQKRPATLERQLEILRKEPAQPEALKFLCQYYLNQGHYSKTITYAEILKKTANKTNNPLLRLYAHLFLAQAQILSGREKVAQKNLNLSLELAHQLNNDSVLCVTYNQWGLYEANINTDYYEALRWLYQGIQLAQRNHLQESYATLLGDLAHIYYLKKDTTGLDYARECYELGHSMQHPFLIYKGAIQSAYHYFLKKQNQPALSFIREAETLMRDNDFYDQAHTYNLFGDILYDMGEYTEARLYFQKALRNKQAAQTSSVVYAHLGCARVWMKQHQYAEAIPLLKQGIAISKARVNAIHRNELYENLSACHEALGHYEEALQNYKIFRLENESQFNKLKERDLSELRFRYDSERQQNLIQQGKLEVLKKEQRIQQQSFILVLIVIVLSLLYYLYQRKNKLYLSIVKQNQEAIKRESELNRRIHVLETQTKSTSPAPEKYASSSLTTEKSLEIFQTLECIMREEKVYRDNTLTKDKLAERLGTNRTYLSRIINEQAQLTFTHYVNRFRIEEAIRRLSDPHDKIPLKALSAELGFNSISTFYNLFQSSVGMTPSQYRNKVIELQKGQ